SQKIIQGTVGPPVAATPDSCTQDVPSTSAITGCTLGASPAADAAAYPCPPTAAQQAAGDTCVLAIGDANGDRAIGTLLFTGEPPPPGSTTTGGPTTTGGATTTTGGATTTTEGATTTTGGATTTTEGATTTTGGATTTTSVPPGPPLTLSSSSVQAGSPVTVTGTGFAPDETVDLALGGPTAIGQTTSDDNGKISVAVTIPSGTNPGTYAITATGETSGVVDTANVTVTAATTVALTGAYELYCPGTPVGDIALNDVTTSATVTPATLTNGATFNVTGYQTSVNLPQSLAQAAAALTTPPATPTLAGTAVGQIDVTGGTPGSKTTGTESFSLPIPSPVPSAGLTLTVPSSPLSIGPFTAQGSAITVQNDEATSLTLMVANAPLTLTCTAYANNSVASGIVTAAPTGKAIAPIIAIAGGGSTATTAAPTPTTKPGSTGTTKPVTAPSGALAFTGPGPGVGVIGILGAVLVLIGIALLVLVDMPRRMLMRLAVVAPAQWQRMRGMDVADRFANLNPMRWRRGHNEGVPDAAAATTVTAPEAPTAPPAAPTTATATRVGAGDRLVRTAEAGRELAITTSKAAMRAAHWLLGR
ncbi:MAG TPA: hypothetical protein VLZ77_13235, partial [Acidimicrobiales bacterium]|nr:hypothetical protein [Acidimicrobiales bacterium]